jgi:4-hydroxy-tetrahydrodipicolinate synthase
MRFLSKSNWSIISVFYDDPFADMHNRMKEALVILGRQKSAYVRPPLVELYSEEIAKIRCASSS